MTRLSVREVNVRYSWFVIGQLVVAQGLWMTVLRHAHPTLNVLTWVGSSAVCATIQSCLITISLLDWLFPLSDVIGRSSISAIGRGALLQLSFWAFAFSSRWLVSAFGFGGMVTFITTVVCGFIGSICTAFLLAGRNRAADAHH